MRKVFAYIRVSTKEQAEHGYSIESQHRILDDYAAGHGLEIVREFVEHESAFKPGREQFREMASTLKRGRGVTAILCYKIDRLARNLSDFAQIVEELGVEIISATEQLPDNAAGRLMGNVQAAFAKYFSEQLSERVALGLETAARSGRWPSLAPCGYRNVHKGLEVDPVLGPMVVELFGRYAREDVGISELTEWAARRGLRSRYGGSLERSAIHKILRNPFYHGLVQWRGSVHKGVHEPIVDQALFDRVQEKLTGKVGPRASAHEFVYRGLLVCGYCGCHLTASLVKGRYVYYHCSRSKGKCEQPFYREEAIAGRLRVVVDGLHVETTILDKIAGECAATEQERERERRGRILTMQGELARIKDNREAAYEDRLNGVVDEALWVRADRRLADRALAIEEEIKRLTAAAVTSDRGLERTFKLLRCAPGLYDRASNEERAHLLKAVASNCVVTAENVVVNYRKPFDRVAEAVTSRDWLGLVDVLQTYRPEFEAFAVGVASRKAGIATM